MTKETLLVIEDNDTLRLALIDVLEEAGYKVVGVANGEDALLATNDEYFDLAISDVEMQGMNGCELLKQLKQKFSELPVILITAYGTIEQAVDAIRSGANEYLVKPFEAVTLLEVVRKHLSYGKAVTTSAVINDYETRKLYNLASKVSRSDVSVLINGESGSGKEVLARYIHENSPRYDKPFVAINCAAIPENMLEAVLFGYEKGAFTGAYQRNPGKFELAQNGTLLLDEISEMDLGLQAKLLRVLQEKEVERLGGKEPVQLNVRVLATTNRDLRKEVKEDRFREDLFYRLNVFPLTVPPLRSRYHDIVPIAEAMIARFFSKLEYQHGAIPKLEAESKQKLLEYSWPGNIRELENVVQRALVVYHGDTVKPDDLVLEGDAYNIEMPSEKSESPVLPADLKKHEQDLILQALARGNGSRKFAAQTLGISPRTLRYKLSKMRERGVKIPSAYGMAS